MAVSTKSKCVAEFLGTYLLVLTVGCNVLSGNSVWGGVSIACVLMVATYALFGISGANFNPAVTFAIGLLQLMGEESMDLKTVGMYWVCQVMGGIFGAISYTALFSQSFVLQPGSGYGWLNSGLCEMLYTFMLTFVVLNVAVAKKNKQENGQYYGLAIGFVIVAGAYGAGPVSGGWFNPAVAIGIDASSGFMSMGWCLTYIVFELIGATCAAALFVVVRPEDFGKEKTLTTKLTSEFLGTFMLVLTVGLNVLAKSPATACSIAASLMSMTYALGDVSGAHFNPAVTIAILASGACPDLTPGVAGSYMGAQIFGGLVAAFTYVFIQKGSSFSLGPGDKFGWVEVAFAEFLFTFVLCYVVLCVAVPNKTKSSHMFGLATGSCVIIGGFAIGGISGGSLNPAVSIGIASSNILSGGMFWKAIGYCAVEAMGAAAAAGIFTITHESEDEPAQKSEVSPLVDELTCPKSVPGVF